MKKIKNIYHLVYSPDNIIKAQANSQKGKGERNEVQTFNSNICENLAYIYDILANNSYKPGKYRIKRIFEPKERVIMIAPFFPDRIIHHCVINVLGEYWNKIFISNTYACIKGRGIHRCMEDINRANYITE